MQRTEGIFSFNLPQDLIAREPPERRGISRSDVKLMDLNRSNYGITHSSFRHLSNFLQPGDLLVFNASRTLPASIVGRDFDTRTAIELRLAEHLEDGNWLALLSCKEGDAFGCRLHEGMVIAFEGDMQCKVESRDTRIKRLWKVRFSKSEKDLISYLHAYGRPISYEYVTSDWGIEYYQNAYSTIPGSMETPSAGRAFTWESLFNLKRKGIQSTFVILHSSLSSYIDEELDERHLLPEEEYFISEKSASDINSARCEGRRVIAVGTTVVRALESASFVSGRVLPVSGERTKLKITSAHRLKAVDGLLTGFHEPRASHLDMLSAFVPLEELRRSYEEAVQHRYLWHEFGDLNLIL
ncbi:MAG TPA: S-adenosylmethionine:tRNA ribosyltransferase-isomerase [Nitrososphaerales archaeon]|nr:S-adenosylmethionine:tRNA ribosyltransferase-isomerase [Nitrososphaerales archaeon]